MNMNAASIVRQKRRKKMLTAKCDCCGKVKESAKGVFNLPENWYRVMQQGDKPNLDICDECVERLIKSKVEQSKGE
jgi:ribosomal protein L34E